MDAISNALIFFFYGLAAVGIATLCGTIVVRLMSFANPRLKDVNGLIYFIYCYATGLIVLPTIYAAYYTNGITVLWLALFLMLAFLFFYRSPVKLFVPINKYVISGLFVGFTVINVFFFLCRFDFHNNLPRPFNYDYGHYVQLFYSMQWNGVESSDALLSKFSPSLVSIPYHYYDIWAAGLWSWPGISPLLGYIMFNPILFLFGIYAIVYFVAISQTSWWQAILVVLLIIGLSSQTGALLELIGIKNKFTAYFQELDVRSMTLASPKLIPLRFFLFLAFLLFFTRSYVSALILLSIVGVLDISNMATSFTALLFIFAVVCRKKFMKWRIEFLTVSAILLLLCLFYYFSFLSSKSIDSHLVANGVASPNLIKIFVFLIKVFIYPQLAHASLFLVIIMFSFEELRKNLYAYLLVACVLFFGGAVYTLLDTLLFFEDAGQFHANNYGLVTVFISLVLVVRVRKTVMVILAFLTINNIKSIVEKIQPNNYRYSKDFIIQVRSELSLSDFGGILSTMVPSNQGYDYKINSLKIFIYPYGIFTEHTGYFFYYLPQYKFHIPLYDLHVPIDSTNARELAIQRQFLFLNYYLNLKKTEPDVSERDAQIRFMKERGIDWIYVHHTYDWPEEWDVYVRKKIVDPNTGDMMVYLKPWNQMSFRKPEIYEIIR
jgi:hypothetical protein